jgi:hypothetical protein
MNKKRTELEKDAAMQRKKKMFLCIIHWFPVLLHLFYMN